MAKVINEQDFESNGKLPLSLHCGLNDLDYQEDSSSQQRKSFFQPHHAQFVPKSVNLEAQAHDCSIDGTPITTMMLRNIPNKYTQNTLLQEIDSLGFAATYDFFYLPMDVHNRSNVGYAFINFELPQMAACFQRIFSDHRFQRFHSRKIGSVCAAHVQGLDKNLRHFENRAVVQARNDQYRPIVWMGRVRIDFEDAVAQAKARALQSEGTDAPPMPPQHGQVPETTLGKPSKAPEARGERKSSKEVARMLPQKVNVNTHGVAHCAVRQYEGLPNAQHARQGLEAVIRDLLASSADGVPENKKDLYSLPECKKDVYSQAHAAAGLLRAPPGLEIQDMDMTESKNGEYSGDIADIAQLLSLRSMLVGCLSEKAIVAPQEQLCMSKASYQPSPAYAGLYSGLYGEEGKVYDFGFDDVAGTNPYATYYGNITIEAL